MLAIFIALLARHSFGLEPGRVARGLLLKSSMNRHWLGILVVIVLAVGGLVLGLALGQPMISLMALLGAVVAGFIMGTAWTRPNPPTEHTDPPAPDDRFKTLRQP